MYVTTRIIIINKSLYSLKNGSNTKTQQHKYKQSENNDHIYHSSWHFALEYKHKKIYNHVYSPNLIMYYNLLQNRQKLFAVQIYRNTNLSCLLLRTQLGRWVCRRTWKLDTTIPCSICTQFKLRANKWLNTNSSFGPTTDPAVDGLKHWRLTPKLFDWLVDVSRCFRRRRRRRDSYSTAIATRLITAWDRFTKYLTTTLRLSYDNANVTINLRRTSNLQNIILQYTESFS